ncbi:hypothetical protein NDU88_001257 [Pleurodeles waltl]|uniref:Uncharacterized protein n=1 Tax=Pleurodeles waltl TaxID=8319 RepID=A0AAV7LX40_PLEWA|nr:hypothetical protein NDU88_001257 [Pleurodeles waltl]
MYPLPLRLMADSGYELNKAMTSSAGSSGGAFVSRGARSVSADGGHRVGHTLANQVEGTCGGAAEDPGNSRGFNRARAFGVLQTLVPDVPRPKILDPGEEEDVFLRIPCGAFYELRPLQWAHVRSTAARCTGWGRSGHNTLDPHSVPWGPRGASPAWVSSEVKVTSQASRRPMSPAPFTPSPRQHSASEF